jgi:hypothetical protein
VQFQVRARVGKVKGRARLGQVEDTESVEQGRAWLEQGTAEAVEGKIRGRSRAVYGKGTARTGYGKSKSTAVPGKMHEMSRLRSV